LPGKVYPITSPVGVSHSAVRLSSYQMNSNLKKRTDIYSLRHFLYLVVLISYITEALFGNEEVFFRSFQSSIMCL